MQSTLLAMMCTGHVHVLVGTSNTLILSLEVGSPDHDHNHDYDIELSRVLAVLCRTHYHVTQDS